MVERALILCDKPTLAVSDFFISGSKNNKLLPLNKNLNLKDNEIKLIHQALLKAGHNQNKASKYLGISRDSLIRRMKKYNIKIQKDINTYNAM
jgi:DNA-binding NtrC family response regulator